MKNIQRLMGQNTMDGKNEYESKTLAQPKLFVFFLKYNYNRIEVCLDYLNRCQESQLDSWKGANLDRLNQLGLFSMLAQPKFFFGLLMSPLQK